MFAAAAVTVRDVTVQPPLDPEAFCAAFAPVVDRLRLGLAHAMRERTMSSEALVPPGISEPGMATITMLRNTYPARAVALSGLRDVFTYLPEPVVETGIRELFDADLVDEPDAGQVRLTARGRELIVAFQSLSGATVSDLWGSERADMELLLALADRAVTAAGETGGPAFAVVAPPYDPPDARAAAKLAERLTALRFHRFDAHMAAWRAAGMTVDEMPALPEGDRRQAIEADTNRRDAAPYTHLTQDERLELLAGLSALPS